MLAVGEIFAEEVQQDVARLLVVAAVHRDLAEKVAHVGVVHHQRAESVPQVVEREKSFRIGSRSLIVGLHERTSELDRVGKVLVAEPFGEAEVVLGREAFRMRAPRDDVTVASDDLFRLGVPDEKLLVPFRVQVQLVDVNVGAGAAAAVAERKLAQPSDLPHQVRTLLRAHDINLVASVVSTPQKALGRQFVFYQIGSYRIDYRLHPPVSQFGANL